MKIVKIGDHTKDEARMEKNYTYFSGHHKNIKKLEGRVGNPRHALVLDKFAFLSLNSNFVLFDRPKENGWFCVEYKQLAEMTGYKTRTITAIVKSFEEAGLIEKIRKIVNNRCRACIRITEKTKFLLRIVDNEAEGQGIVARKKEIVTENNPPLKKLPEECTFESAKNAVSYNEEKRNTESVNIITRSSRDNNNKNNVPDAISAMFSQIGERLGEKQKKQIYGAMCNLQRQSSVTISNQAEYFAWIAFAILNAEHHLKGCETFEMKLNTIMKIARSPGGFSKPRGFHNHWDIGISLKQKEKTREIEHRKHKKGRVNQGLVKNYTTPNQPGSQSCVEGEFTARKAKDVWEDESIIRALKAKRAGLMGEINALMSDTKALSVLFAKDIVMQKTQALKNNEKIKCVELEIKQVDKDIAFQHEQQAFAQDTQWQGLYEAG